ncbi:hypothetical protein [Hymenobacter psoromatis]|uniref:hypothetical protein n=1 Tax=Hymenobacter psoromatis TaxID=1484116 RepID=UPI001CBCAC0D|nr:hypothetical protein [Hymenobacter psoromatis]
MLTSIQRASSLVLVLSAGSLFTSCDKKDPAPETPGFHLFTNQMEITDATVKAIFLKHSAGKYLTESPVGPTDKITFLTPDTVLFGSSTFRYSIVKRDNQYLFYSPTVFQGFNKYQLIRDMLKYTTPKVAVPAFLNYDYATQEVRVGYGDSKHMQLSYLQYYWIRTDRLSPGWSAGFSFNELNETIASKVIGTDTLAVQVGSAAIPVQ